MLTACVAGITALAASLRSEAQMAGGQFEIRRSTVDGGGGLSTVSGYELRGTIGQPDVGVASGGAFSLYVGFWAPEIPARPELVFGDSFEG
ncbi:MAG: hypothetical protein QNJ40_04690 [Xanthomonadales bacterium]|nr:hypothetical protein [Xanthomonadales bacterium]